MSDNVNDRGFDPEEYQASARLGGPRKQSESAPATGSHSDTERLNFLLKFLSIEDFGDEFYCPGVSVNEDAMMEALNYEPHTQGAKIRAILVQEGDDLRKLIDRAIDANTA